MKVTRQPAETGADSRSEGRTAEANLADADSGVRVNSPIQEQVPTRRSDKAAGPAPAGGQTQLKPGASIQPPPEEVSMRWTFSEYLPFDVP